MPQTPETNPPGPHDEDALSGEPTPCIPIADIEAVLTAAEPDANLVDHLRACPRCRPVAVEIQANHRLLDRIEALGRNTVSLALARSAPPDGIPLDIVPGYQFVGEVNCGSQAVVYEAVQRTTTRTVALKLLIQGQFATTVQQLRFQRGIELAAGLQHPNIVTIHDSGITPDGRPYCAMEYVRGWPLGEYLRRRRGELISKPSRVLIREIVVLFEKIADAAHYAHRRGVVHRDLKAANILVDHQGEPHICDFGMAKAIWPNRWAADCEVSAEGVFAGTFAYAAPELLTFKRPRIGPQTDVYAIGVNLYEALTGRLPYRDMETMSEMIRSIAEEPVFAPSLYNAAIDRDLDAIVLEALAKDANERYEGAGELRADLGRWRRQEPVAARSASRWYRVQVRLRRRWRAIAHVAIVVALLAAVILLSLLLAQERQRTRGLESSPPETSRAEVPAG